MLQKLMNFIRVGEPPELKEARETHRDAVNKSVEVSNASRDIVRDITANARSALRAVDNRWGHKI